MNRDYIITKDTMDFTTSNTIIQSFETREKMMNKMLKKQNDFMQAILIKKEQGKVKPLTSLDEETMFDLKVSMYLTNNNVAKIYDMSGKKVSEFFCRKGIYSIFNEQQCYKYLKYGIRDIDVDKFVEYLTYE